MQIAYIAATCAYTFVVTALIAKGVDFIPGLKLRSTPEAEHLGMDEVEVCDKLSSDHRPTCSTFDMTAVNFPFYFCRSANSRATTSKSEGTSLKLPRLASRPIYSHVPSSLQATDTVNRTQVFTPTAEQIRVRMQRSLKREKRFHMHDNHSVGLCFCYLLVPGGTLKRFNPTHSSHFLKVCYDLLCTRGVLHVSFCSFALRSHTEVGSYWVATHSAIL